MQGKTIQTRTRDRNAAERREKVKVNKISGAPSMAPPLVISWPSSATVELEAPVEATDDK